MDLVQIILSLLEQNYPGVRKDGLKHLATSLALTVSTDEEATTVVGKLTADNVNKFVTDWRKEADAEIDKANKTIEAMERAVKELSELYPKIANTNLAALHHYTKQGGNYRQLNKQLNKGTLTEFNKASASFFLLWNIQR